jgi:hypothetical protein
MLLSNRVCHRIRSKFLNELVQFPVASTLTSSMSTNSWDVSQMNLPIHIPIHTYSRYLYSGGYFLTTANSSFHPLLCSLLVSVPCLASLAWVDIPVVQNLCSLTATGCATTLTLSILIRKGKRCCLLCMLSFIIKYKCRLKLLCEKLLFGLCKIVEN